MIEGTFHFHSTYSHDGRNTLSEIARALREEGYSFCVMTDHFEDFDSQSFDRFIAEIDAVSREEGFLLIPGAEVDLLGLHTIIFPAMDFATLTRLAKEGKDTDPPLFKVLAHPTKYRFELIMKHLETYNIRGIELWNQQADSSYLPPLQFLEQWRGCVQRYKYISFFGCDIHNIGFAVANVLALSADTPLTTEAVTDCLRRGEFTCRNLPTSIEFGGAAASTEIYDAWIESLAHRQFASARSRNVVRKSFRAIYRSLPRSLRHSLNDVKNVIRNSI